MYEVELKDGRILSMNARDVQMFRPLIRAFMLARPKPPSTSSSSRRQPTASRITHR